jgi:hypothetical protein
MTAAIFASRRDEHKPLHRWKRLCFPTLRFGSAEQEADEFGLPMSTGLLENVREMGFGRGAGDAAPARGGLAAVSLRNFDAPRLGRSGGADFSRAMHPEPLCVYQGGTVTRPIRGQQPKA